MAKNFNLGRHKAFGIVDTVEVTAVVADESLPPGEDTTITVCVENLFPAGSGFDFPFPPSPPPMYVNLVLGGTDAVAVENTNPQTIQKLDAGEKECVIFIVRAPDPISAGQADYTIQVVVSGLVFPAIYPSPTVNVI